MSFRSTLTVFHLALMLIFGGTLPLATQDLRPTAQHYLLRTNDVVEIKYRYTPQFNETVKVQPDGHATVTLVGDVELAGLTLNDAKVLIQRKVSEKLRDPEMDVSLSNFDRPYFVVAGQVAAPGRFDLSGTNTSVIEAIAQAGGFKNSARNTEVIVYHRSGSDLTLRYVINCKRVMEHPNQEVAKMSVQSGDVIVVPQNRFSSVERIVKLTNLGVYYPLPQ